MISESYKKRIKSLSGIKLQEVELKATSGRSDKNSLSYFVEEYLLNLGGMFFDELKNKISENSNKELRLDSSNNKISNNSLLVNFSLIDNIDKNNIQKMDFNLSFVVKLESNSNTVAILKYDNLNDEFNLQTKHSESDLKDFLNEISTRVINVEKTT